MSKAAQEMQRLADDLRKRAKGRQRTMAADADVHDGLGMEPEAEAAAPDTAPTEQPTQGEAAPAADTATTAAGEGEDMATKKQTRTRAKSTAAKSAAKPKAPAAAKPAKPAKAAKPAAPAAAPAAAGAAPRPAKVRDPLAGIRQKPKLQGVLLGAEISRRVVLKALQAVDQSKLTDEAEKREVTRLIARIEARG